MSQNIPFSLPAFAKINLTLKVLGKRDDGFHEISTVFQTVSLHDTLTFSADEEFILTCDSLQIPLDDQNLIVRAGHLLRTRFGINRGARIRLEKRVPSPGGLGGGSADGAIALLGLAKLWKLKISLAEICEIGKTLGSDVPFFFFGGTALGSGRGTEIVPLQDFAAPYLLIVTPQVDIRTASAFAGLNSSRLTNASSKRILQFCDDEAAKPYSMQGDSVNDFESVVFRIEPEIKRVKEKLLQCGAKSALMSGSGASVFGIFENDETRQATLKALLKEVKWRKFVVATVSRESYREALKSVFEVVSN